MSETSEPSAPQTPEQPAAGPPRTEPQTPPQNIIIHVGGQRVRRVFLWIGWAGFIACVCLLVGQSRALRRYFDTTGGVQEKYHSGSKYAAEKVAIISVKGAILEGGGFVRSQIDRVREDPDVKAVVLRIESPGGTIYGSDYIYHHLKKLREDRAIPIVVSMGSVAASGGYYVAMAVGDQPKSIFAEPTTTTGSIGVIIPHYDLSGLLARLDIKEDSMATHPRKQMLSMMRPISEDHRRLLQAHLDEAFQRFKDVVKAGRPAFRMDPDALDQLATGEVFTASQAQRHGLVDEIGFLEDAIDRAIGLAGLDKAKTRVVKFERTDWLLDVPLLVRADGRQMDLATWLDLNSPRVYYLATTLPTLMSCHAGPAGR